MSRCFPYPPPGYEKKNEPLIESIKLQKESERAKERKKDKKKEKKEKKDKSGERQREGKKHGHKKRCRDERSQLDPKDGYNSKRTEEETEQLERSGLTEEQGLPSVQYVCDSPDSSQNSSKRKKHDVADVSKNIHGSGIRIRLPLLKHKGPEQKVPVEQPCFSGRTDPTPGQPCFSGRTEPTPLQPCFSARTEPTCPPLFSGRKNTAHVQQPCLSARMEPATAQPSFPTKMDAVPVPPCLPGRMETVPAEEDTKPGSDEPTRPPLFSGLKNTAPKQPCLSVRMEPATAQPSFPTKMDAVPVPPCLPGRMETVPAEEDTKPGSDELSCFERYSGSSRSRRKEAKFKDLMENWKPQSLQMDQPEADDQDWLFGSSRSQRNNDLGRCQGGSQLSSQGSSLCSWPPRASHLPEGDIYALPFVVPF